MTSRQPHSTNDVTAAVLVPLPLTGTTRRPLTKDHGEFRGLLKKKKQVRELPSLDPIHWCVTVVCWCSGALARSVGHYHARRPSRLTFAERKEWMMKTMVLGQQWRSSCWEKKKETWKLRTLVKSLGYYWLVSQLTISASGPPKSRNIMRMPSSEDILRRSNGCWRRILFLTPISSVNNVKPSSMWTPRVQSFPFQLQADEKIKKTQEFKHNSCKK